MKRKFQSLIALSAALLGAGTGVQAQEISTSLPLTSIGDRLMWSVADQNLQLNVPVAGQVKLELYSPRVDPQDYRSDTYFGDETYSPEEVSTTFTLLREDGSVVITQTFTPGAQHWETLFDLNLPAGNYKLQAQTSGNGKNTFAVRLAGVSADLSAERLAVNVHASDWTPVLNVSVDGAGYSLRMYDGDGPQELEARLRDAAGNVYPLAVSGDLAWSDLPLPDQAGQYTVELRQPKTAKQYSNTVSFGLTRQGAQTPITLTRVDQTGLLRVSAELLLPNGTVPTSVNVMVGGEHLQVDGQTEKTVAAGEYPVTVTDLPGASVSADRSSVSVTKGGVGEVKVQVKPEVALTLESDKLDVCVGDSVTLTARAATAYAGNLPLDLNIDAPGLTFSAETNLQGELSAANPGELRLTGTATQAGPLSVTARLAPWNAEQSVKLNVRPDATSLQLSRAALGDAKLGDEVTVRLTLKNTAAQAVPFTLQDQPGAGLQALGSTTFSGTLNAGEERELTYQAKVTAESAAQVELQARLDSPACPAPQTVGGSLNVAPRPAPGLSRRSTMTLPFDAPRETQVLTIAQALPAGASLVAGSSKLDGKTIADPKRGPSGTLYWVVPAPTGNGTEKGAALRGMLSYDVNHKEALGALPQPSLSVLLPGNRTELLQGQLNAKDFAAATTLKSDQNSLAENAGAIKLPLVGTVVRVRDRISITVEAPQGDIPALTVNGKPVSNDLIGTNTQDGVRGVQRLTFVGVPIQSGKNVIAFNGEQIEVGRVGATANIEVTPMHLLADGGTPIRLKVRTLDAFGQLTDQATVTLRSNLEPRTPDANAGESGYQIKLVGGEGIIELQPQSSPTSLRLDILQNGDVQTYRYEIRPDASRVGVGNISATVGLNSGSGGFSVQNNVTWQARAYYEGPIGQGKLYLAADKDGLPNDEKTLIRYPVYGDASTESVPLQGLDPVAFTYDHPSFRADYRRTSLPIEVLPVGEQLTALTVSSKTDPKISGFVALVPKDAVKDLALTPSGTRVLHLPEGDISDGSDTLQLAVLERGTGKELKRTTLQRNVDYVIDYRSGVITLSRAVDRVDLDLNEQVFMAGYRRDNPLAKRQLAYGAQLKKTGANYVMGVAAVSLDNVVTFGARATYDNGTTRADGLVAYSGGVQVSADLSSKPSERQSFSARLRYQQAGYQGLGRFGDGLSIGGNYTTKLTDRLSAVVDAEYHRAPTANADPVSGITAPDTAQGGSVTARADYKFDPFTVGLGAKYAFGDQHGFGLVGNAGYQRENFSVSVLHTQPVTGNLNPTTDVSTKFRVGKNVNLGFTDKITWGVGHSAALALDTMIGNVNYAVGYELPTASGAGNRARFSVQTSLPLNNNLALGVRGSALYSLKTQQGEVGAGADLNYKTDRLSATVGSDVSYKTDKGFGVVLRGGITGSVTDQFTLTADGLMEKGQDKNGQRFSLGYAYRARSLASLGYVRYVNGTLAGNTPELSTGFNTEYRQPTWAVRGGVDTRTLLKDTASFTWQANLGGTAYLNDYFGIGAWGRLIGQPSTGYQAFGYGVEGSVRALPGTWLTAGYNFKGFEGLPSAGTYTKQGAYLRLDLTLDETLGGKK